MLIVIYVVPCKSYRMQKSLNRNRILVQVKRNQVQITDLRSRIMRYMFEIILTTKITDHITKLPSEIYKFINGK